MENYDDRYLMPLGVGNELTVESFRLAQYDNTYMLAAPRYYQFYASYVRPRVLMYNGWIEGFHNLEYGVIPSLFLQKIGNGIINTVFGKPLVLNTEDANTESVMQKQYKKAHFPEVLKEAYSYALAGGAGLIKINKDGKENLRFEAVPMDKFFVETDSYGDVNRIKCFIATYHNTISSAQEYYLCEERFFRYVNTAGVQKRFPMVHYLFYKTSSNIVNEATPEPTDAIRWQDIPYDVRKLIQSDYGDIYIDGEDGSKLKYFDNCKLLPFDDDLGCRLVKFTNSIPAFPKLPFGQPLADLLMNESYAYDQLKFFERLEVYVARARAMVDETQTNPNDPDARKRALDPLVFTFYDNVMGDSKDGKPVLIQPALRAEEIRTQKQNILNDTAFALNLSSSTIAAWLSDGTSQKTATEIEYERTKTESFINEKIELLQAPMQELVDLYFHFYGVTAPELRIVPESQGAVSDTIRLYSELYDKGQITAKKLAEKILGTCSVKEVNELADYIDFQRQSGQALMQQQPNVPQMSGEVESPTNGMPEAETIK